MLIELDDGYSFGLGLFETILLYKGKPVFLDEHLARINKSVVDLGLNIGKLEKNEVFQYLNNSKNILEYEVLKIVLSEKNRLFLKREYTYTEKDYQKGFSLNISKVRRNETKIYTPKLSCGLLNGIVRQYIISNYDVTESEIDLEFLNNADEIFLTNSLLGIIAVNNLEKKVFKSQKISKEIFNSYKKYIMNI